jgi:hypothetical protein
MPPEEIILTEESFDCVDRIHYVPLLKNLTVMFNNKNIQNEFFKPKISLPNEILSLNDSSKFKNSVFFYG